MTLNLTKNAQLGVILHILVKKSHFEDPIDLHFFSWVTLNLFCRDASFKHPYDYIWNDEFFYQKRGIG